MPECKYQYWYCFDADCRARCCAGCEATVEQIILSIINADFIGAAC